MLVIGDIHGRHQALNRLLKNQWNGKDPIIFLGDFNDSEVEDSSFLEVWKIVKPLFEKGLARAPQSNHCERLLGHLLGKDRGETGSFGNTVNELKDISEETKTELIQWLQSMPIGLVVEEMGQQWAFYHACPSPKAHIAINGPHKQKRRVEWWLDTSLSPLTNWVVGHYGLLQIHKNGKGLIVLVDTPKEENSIGWFKTTSLMLGKVFA